MIRKKKGPTSYFCNVYTCFVPQFILIDEKKDLDPIFLKFFSLSFFFSFFFFGERERWADQGNFVI